MQLAATSAAPMPHVDIEDLIAPMATLLNEQELASFGNSRKALWELFRKNAKLEALCIAACEGGEVAAQVLLYEFGLQHWNELALPGGFAAGLTYAASHIYKHAKAYGIKPNWVDALRYALTTESGCVVGATTTEWLAGNLSGAQTPYEPEALIYSGAALPIAFLVGLSAMSISSFVRKNVFDQLIVEKDEVPDQLTMHESSLREAGLQLNINKRGNRIGISGTSSTFKIKLDGVPRHLRQQHDPRENQRATLKHPLARTNGEVVDSLRAFFDEMVPSGFRIENPYECGGHEHGHSKVEADHSHHAHHHDCCAHGARTRTKVGDAIHAHHSH